MNEATPFDEPRGAGDNRPPADADPMTERMAEDHAEILARTKELLDAAERAPASVNDDEGAGKFGDFIKSVTGTIKRAETARKAEKEPYLVNSRKVDGFFKKRITEPLADAKKALEKTLGVYLQAKAAAERKAREEAEKAAREAEAAARREAEEREKALEAEATPFEDPGDGPSEYEKLESAVEAEEAAAKAKKEADKAAKAASAKAADLARTRGDHGSVGTLRTEWKHDEPVRADLDLEALREHLSIDALEKAIRSYIKANAPEKVGGPWPKPLAGVRIFEKTTTTVR